MAWKGDQGDKPYVHVRITTVVYLVKTAAWCPSFDARAPEHRLCPERLPAQGGITRRRSLGMDGFYFTRRGKLRRVRAGEHGRRCSRGGFRRSYGGDSGVDWKIG